MSANDIFCLAMLVSFFLIILKEQAVRNGWLLGMFRKQLEKEFPARRQKLIHRWTQFTLLSANQYETLEAEYIISESGQDEIDHPSIYEHAFEFSKQELNQSSGHAVITAHLPLSLRMKKIHALNLQIIYLANELNLYYKKEDHAPYEVKL